jgi:hypothetical protein
VFAAFRFTVMAMSAMSALAHPGDLTPAFCPAEAMTPDDFARVCIANGLLKSPAAKTRLASGFDDDDERSNEEIFAELKAKWDVRGDEMMARIEEVEDEELKESLLARVARHNEVCVLVVRVAPGGGGLCMPSSACHPP